MLHTHVTLVGAQPMPVYIGIKDCNPDHIVYVCSSRTRSQAERVNNEVSCSSEIVEINPVDLSSIFEYTRKLAERVTNNSVSINISGGTKPWSYYFIDTFSSRQNTRIFYVDQNNMIWSFSNRAGHIANLNVNMDVLFRLYGNSVNSYRDINDYSRDDLETIDRIKNFRKFNPFDFAKLTNNFDQYPSQTRQQLRSGSSLEWISKKELFAFRLYNRNGESRAETFDSLHVKELLLNTGWFEVDVAFMLNKWERTHEVRVNCIFPAENSTPKNEIDIIVNTGVKMLFVECKTRLYKITDIDKFRSAVNNYGGLGSKALFITDIPLNEISLEKCADNNILSFSIKENGGIKHCQKALFALLEKELLQINTK